MPVYDYKCKNHGIFNQLATLEDFQKPLPCPTCGDLAPRVVCLSPDLLKLDKGLHDGMERNEKAQHEPLLSTLDQRSRDKAHRSACGCDGRKAGKRSVLYTAKGEKMFPTARPWMVSH